MIKIYIATDEAVAVITRRSGEWVASVQLVGKQTRCLSLDPLRPRQVYCGTFDQGLWRSADGGETWEYAWSGPEYASVTAVAVSLTERAGENGIIYAGTEPSTLFRSVDGGSSWQELTALRQLPSAPGWSFPPRPYTSHVRWITPDPLVEGRLFAAIEAGALVRSLDGGRTWEDRKADGPYDTHTLVMHPQAPDQLYSAAGDGFMRPGQGFVASGDGGETWSRPDAGLEHHYLWGLAADPADPTTLVLSAAYGPQQAHNPQTAESTLYRRSGQGQWAEICAGLPEPRGLLASVLATHAAEPGVFYAASNQGVFRSDDAGLNWDALPIRWPRDFHPGRAHALLVTLA